MHGPLLLDRHVANLSASAIFTTNYFRLCVFKDQTLDNSSFQHLIGIGLVLEAEGGGLFIRAT